jgi:hypothetical protein
MVRLLGRVISSSQGFCLRRTTQHRKTRTNIHALSGIRTRDPVYERSRPAPQTALPLDRHIIIIISILLSLKSDAIKIHVSMYIISRCSLVTWLVDNLLLSYFGPYGIIIMDVCILITATAVMLLRDFGPYRIIFMTVCVYYRFSRHY